MIKICPDCDNSFNGFKCKCGYKYVEPPKDNSKCAIISCTNRGVVSSYTGKDIPYYCHDHFKDFNHGGSVKKPDPILNKACKELFMQVMNGSVSSMDLVEKMGDLHKEYPNAGFLDEANKILERVKRELDLSLMEPL